MSSIAWEIRPHWEAVSRGALNAATRFWFVAAVFGQWAFLCYIARFYGPSTFSGQLEGWARNTFLIKGYVAGDRAGNFAFAAHALLAAVTSFGGALQLIPAIRRRAMAVHRWNGRLFLVTALGVSVSGLYMVWVRGTRVSTLSALAVSLNAVLIIVFAIAAWRTALRGEIAKHRVAALRTFLVANGQWFLRVGMFAWLIVNRGPVGMTKDMSGGFDLFWMVGCYLVPLGVLEVYLRVQSAPPRARLVFAGALFILTLVMAAGIFGVAMFMWRPMLARL